MCFKEWLLKSGLTEKTVKEYSNAVSRSITKWASEGNTTNKNLLGRKGAAPFIVPFNLEKYLWI